MTRLLAKKTCSRRNMFWFYSSLAVDVALSECLPLHCFFFWLPSVTKAAALGRSLKIVRHYIFQLMFRDICFFLWRIHWFARSSVSTQGKLYYITFQNLSKIQKFSKLFSFHFKPRFTLHNVCCIKIIHILLSWLTICCIYCWTFIHDFWIFLNIFCT